MQVEEKIRELEKRLERVAGKRLARRDRATKVYYQGCVLYCHAASVRESGEVGRVLFPVAGALRKALVRVPGASEKTPIRITLEFWRANTAEAKVLLVGKESLSAVVDLEILEGDRLLVFSGEPTLRDFELSLFFVPKGTAYSENVVDTEAGETDDERVSPPDGTVSKDGLEEVLQELSELSGSGTVS